MNERIIRQITRPDFTGKKITVDVMDFRKKPGQMIDFARNGGVVHILKNKKPACDIVPTQTIIRSDGSWEGETPLTMKQNLGDKY